MKMYPCGMFETIFLLCHENNFPAIARKLFVPGLVFALSAAFITVQTAPPTSGAAQNDKWWS